MRAGRRLIWVLLALLAAAVLLIAQTWWLKPLRLNWFYDRTFLQSLIDSPMAMSNLQLLDGTWLDGYSGELDDFSITHEDKEFDRARANKAVFESYDAANLTGADKVSWGNPPNFH